MPGRLEEYEEEVRERAIRHLGMWCDVMTCPTDLVAILDGLGIHLFARPCEIYPKFTGVAVQDDGVRLIIVNSLLSTPRKLFTISHEIGHIVLEHRPPRTPDHEHLANVYAAELLMPAPRLAYQLCQHGPDIAYLAQLNNVSLSAMARRIHELRER